MIKGNPKIIFFGTPRFAAGVFQALIENKYNVVAVVTQPDKKVGRRHEVVFSPVRRLAIKHGIKVFQPGDLRESGVIREIRETGADLFVVAAYGKILPKIILDIPHFGSINVHASLLPKYRGASPAQCAILNGEHETGVTLMLMNEKMDEGDILAQEKENIGRDDTAKSLLRKLEKLGAKLTTKYIPEWIAGRIRPTSQNQNEATYCSQIRREDGRIDWQKSAEEIYRKWRAYHPWPGVFSLIEMKNKLRRIKLEEIEIALSREIGQEPGKVIAYKQKAAVSAKDGLVIIKKIQIEGKSVLGIQEFMRGYPSFVGSVLKK